MDQQITNDKASELDTSPKSLIDHTTRVSTIVSDMLLSKDSVNLDVLRGTSGYLEGAEKQDWLKLIDSIEAEFKSIREQFINDKKNSHLWRGKDFLSEAGATLTSGNLSSPEMKNALLNKINESWFIPRNNFLLSCFTKKGEEKKLLVDIKRKENLYLASNYPCTVLHIDNPQRYEIDPNAAMASASIDIPYVVIDDTLLLRNIETMWSCGEMKLDESNPDSKILMKRMSYLRDLFSNNFDQFKKSYIQRIYIEELGHSFDNCLVRDKFKIGSDVDLFLCTFESALKETSNIRKIYKDKDDDFSNRNELFYAFNEIFELTATFRACVLSSEPRIILSQWMAYLDKFEIQYDGDLEKRDCDDANLGSALIAIEAMHEYFNPETDQEKYTTFEELDSAISRVMNEDPKKIRLIMKDIWDQHFSCPLSFAPYKKVDKDGSLK